LLPALGWQLLLSQVAFTRCFEIERQIFSSKGRCDKHQHQPSGRQRTRGQTRIRYRFWPHVSAHALLLTATSARTLCRWPTKVSHERLSTVINHQSASSFKHCLPVEHSPRKPHTAHMCLCCATPFLSANHSSVSHHMNPAPFCAGRWVLGHAAHARTRVHWAKQSDASVPTALRCRCVVSQPRHQRVDRTSVSCGDTRRTWLRRNSGGRVLRKQATQLRVTATGCVSARLLQV
jgi:hypothetical protein